jgi:hypothetical protein
MGVRLNNLSRTFFIQRGKIHVTIIYYFFAVISAKQTIARNGIKKIYKSVEREIITLKVHHNLCHLSEYLK